MSLPEYKGNATDFYLAPKQVAEVVNLAIWLGRPLLVEGEPGCGKTMLASSVGEELGLSVIKIAVKSTSRAQDLLFRVNALRRLQDAQQKENQEARYVYPYVTLEPLGKAIHSPARSVVLIDEIDKADIDFPNDLLEVLDNFRFEIDELPVDESEICENKRGFGRRIEGKGERPVVIITSNREKRLPEPFLRRCLYVQLRFPDDTASLRDIVEKNIRKSGGKIDDALRGWLDDAIASFRKVRSKAIEHRLQKPPTTGELIDWIRVLHWQGVEPGALKSNPGFPPKWELLFKTMDDVKDFGNLENAPAEA